MELAWAAGFYDGEGNIWLRRVRPGIGPRVTIQQTDPAVLHRFRAAVRGLGNVVGPYTRKARNGSPFWAFQCLDWRGAQAIVAMLWRFLSPVKREQAARVLREYRAMDLGPRRAYVRKERRP